MKDRRLLLGLLAVASLGVIAFFVMSPAMGVSSDDMRRAEAACVGWFEDERDLGGSDPFSSDVWEKDGSVVVEVGFDKSGNSYSTRLCVYDLDSDRMSAPNNFTRSRWEK